MTYKIKLTSQAHAFALLIVLFVGFILLVSIVPRPNTKQWTWLICISYMLLGIVLWRKSVVGETLWTVTNDEVSMEWLKRYRFDTNSKGFILRWDEILNFKIGFDGGYKKIKIELVSTEIIVFFHDNIGRDDFRAFTVHIQQELQKRKAAANKGLPKPAVVQSK